MKSFNRGTLHNSLGQKRYLTAFYCYFSGACLYTIIPVPGYEWLNPGIIVTVKDNFLGTSDDQTIHFHNLLPVDLTRTAAEVCETEIRAAFVERPVGNDSYSKVGGERNNLV